MAERSKIMGVESKHIDNKTEITFTRVIVSYEDDRKIRYKNKTYNVAYSHFTYNALINIINEFQMGFGIFSDSDTVDLWLQKNGGWSFINASSIHFIHPEKGSFYDTHR
jgi:hypothetical protein